VTLLTKPFGADPRKCPSPASDLPLSPLYLGPLTVSMATFVPAMFEVGYVQVVTYNWQYDGYASTAGM
jgi:hypothetical protein